MLFKKDSIQIKPFDANKNAPYMHLYKNKKYFYCTREILKASTFVFTFISEKQKYFPAVVTI